MSATTTQLLSSGEFCKLRYDNIPVKSATTIVSFYSNYSKMPDFDLWHSCQKWAVCYLKSKTIIVHLLKYIKLCYKRSKCYAVVSLISPSLSPVTPTAIVIILVFRVTVQYVTRFPYTPCHISEHALDWMCNDFCIPQSDTAKTALVLSTQKHETQRYETHNNTYVSVSWIQRNNITLWCKHFTHFMSESIQWLYHLMVKHGNAVRWGCCGAKHQVRVLWC